VGSFPDAHPRSAIRRETRRQTCRRTLRNPCQRSPSRGRADWRNSTHPASQTRVGCTTVPKRPLRVLVEGRPAVGKTTVALRLAALLREAGVPLAGFVTEEQRERGRRVGFAIETFDGERAILAHVDLPGPPRVGRYGVDLPAFEGLALPALASPPDGGVVLIDELGKMELASETFRAAVTRLLEQPVPLVATVHVARHLFTDALKGRPDLALVRVAAANRDELPAQLAAQLVQGLHAEALILGDD
jgi:nucleoside-triphosphatase